MAELHIIGQILDATDFEDGSLFTKWSIQTGSCWRVLEGFNSGQTQLTIKRTVNSRARYPWSHPIDIHYATRGLQGWPRIEFQIWGVDWLGKANISAYGFVNVPTQPGYHELTCSTWRPVGDFRRRVMDYITGYRMHLIDPSDIVSSGLNRHAIQSISMGTVKVQLTVVLRGFDKYGLDV